MKNQTSYPSGPVLTGNRSRTLSGALAGTLTGTLTSAVALLLKGYRYAISPLFGQHCRFHPSCSAYALEAIESHGLARGGLLTLRRLGNCHPWHPGGFDPVPHRDDDESPGIAAGGGR